QSCSGGQETSPTVVLTQRGQGGADACRGAGCGMRGPLGMTSGIRVKFGRQPLFRLKPETTGIENVQPAAGLLVLEQLGVAQAEEGAAEDVDEGQRVLRVGEGAQEDGQGGDLLGLAEGA